ncbi:hypothetical protein UB46_15660 [Burkholderiaceae bacterium 16]|nr:hypothetical protein UB46_15660 [Burkholderiaceae bacterium 16]
MWQVPSMAIAATGGLWFGVTLVDSSLPKTGLLVFAAIIDFLTILIVIRIRWVLQKSLDLQKAIEGRSGKERAGLIVICWSVMLFAAAILSVLGAFNTHELAKKTALPALPMECNFDSTVNVGSLQPSSISLPIQRQKTSRHQASKKQCP